MKDSMELKAEEIMKRVKIGELLKNQRNLMDKSIGDMHEITGLSKTHLFEVERGVKSPSEEAAEVIARAYNVDVNELLCSYGKIPVKLSKELLRSKVLRNKLIHLIEGKSEEERDRLYEVL